MNVDPSFRDLYRREFPSVCRAVYLLAGDRELAEDAAQEAFARALARWRRVAAHPAPGGWVTKTALNVARRHLRKRVASAPPPDDVNDAGEAAALHLAIRKLPSRQLEAVALHYLLDMSVAETAASMEVDEGTVKTHLSRARATLARSLADPLPDSDQKEGAHERHRTS